MPNSLNALSVLVGFVVCLFVFSFTSFVPISVLDSRSGSTIQWRVVSLDLSGKLSSPCAMQWHEKVITCVPWSTLVSAFHSAKINLFCFYSTDENILLLIPELPHWILTWMFLLHSAAYCDISFRIYYKTLSKGPSQNYYSAMILTGICIYSQKL